MKSEVKIDILAKLDFIKTYICKSPMPLECPICKHGNLGIGFDFCLLKKLIEEIKDA